MSLARLAVVTETAVPDVNGVANSIQHLLLALERLDVEIQLIRPRPKEDWTPHFNEIWTTGVRIPMYPDLQLGLPASRSLRRQWQGFRPQLVYIATEGPLGLSARRVADAMGIPVISAFHTNFHRYSRYYGMGWIQNMTLRWLRHFHNSTRATLVPADEVRQSLLPLGFERVEVFPHGVDCQLFRPECRREALRSEWQADEQTQVMLYVGRVAAEKNIPMVLQAFEQLKRKHAGLRLVVVGDGPMRESLQHQHRDVIFAGVQTGEQLAAYYASADLFVFPSVTETFGLVTLEAMASGIPVAAFDLAAAHMFVSPGVEGELADEAQGEEGFIAAVDRLLQRDLQLAGRAARQIAEQNSWACVADRFQSVISLSPESPLNDKIANKSHSLV